MKSIREQYSETSVEAFYSGGVYKNPHAKEINALLEQNHRHLDLSSVLDMSCGDGLVTSKLISLGHSNVIGSDPYLQDLYSAETNLHCFKRSFKDIAIKGFPVKFSCVVCSFALHLCERSLLPDLLWRLSMCTSCLVVISPSKFPLIGKPRVEKFANTDKGKRVHFRVYDLPIL